MLKMEHCNTNNSDSWHATFLRTFQISQLWPPLLSLWPSLSYVLSHMASQNCKICSLPLYTLCWARSSLVLNLSVFSTRRNLSKFTHFFIRLTSIQVLCVPSLTESTEVVPMKDWMRYTHAYANIIPSVWATLWWQILYLYLYHTTIIYQKTNNKD